MDFFRGLRTALSGLWRAMRLPQPSLRRAGLPQPLARPAERGCPCDAAGALGRAVPNNQRAAKVSASASKGAATFYAAASRMGLPLRCGKGFEPATSRTTPEVKPALAAELLVHRLGDAQLLVLLAMPLAIPILVGPPARLRQLVGQLVCNLGSVRGEPRNSMPSNVPPLLNHV